MQKILALLLVLTVTSLHASFVNTGITRNIGATHNNAIKLIASFTVKRTQNNDDKPYVLWLPSETQGGRLARVKCEVDGKAAEVEVTKQEASVELAVAVKREWMEGKVECTTLRVGHEARRPLPAEINQVDRQKFVLESETERVASPYALQGEENSLFVMPSGRIEVLSDSPACSVNGPKVQCGPYKESSPSSKQLFSEFTKNRIRIHYDANFAFPLATSVEREIEVSHWGNVAVEEYFDVRNDGALLKNGFSRLDHQMKDPKHSFQALDAYLPSDAYGIYYRDELGNVTSSHLRKSRTGKFNLLQMKLRFPVYGGWHINWYQGYNLPLASMVTRVPNTSDRYLLECDLFHPISIVAEKLTIHLVLPPGATNVKIESPQRDMEQDSFRRYTYLDVPWTSRNVITLELNDVFGGDVAESGVLPRNNAEDRLRIYYTYSDAHILEKPLSVSATIFACLMAYMLMARLSS